jgi:hypothetical protein
LKFNNFYHLFFVYTPGMQYTYVNGQLVNAKDNSQGIGNSFFGEWSLFTDEACPGGNGGLMSGIAEELRFYNRSFSDHEVSQLYWDYLKNLQTGSNEIMLNNCNLIQGQTYNVIGFSDSQKIDTKVIAR